MGSRLPARGVRRSLASLRHPNYRLYWAGQVVSLAGTWMQTVAQSWLVLELGGTPFQLAAVVSLQYLPPTFLGPLAGVLADRVDKRRALVVVQVVAMVQAATLLVLVVGRTITIEHILVLATVLGVVNAVDQPMRQSFAAELVPPKDLMNAVALNAASLNTARIVGPGIAGVAIASHGIAFTFGLNVLSYFAVLICLLLINGSKLAKIPLPAKHPSFVASLQEGISHVRSTPVLLWPLVVLAGMATFGMNFQTLIPLFAREPLHLGPEGYGALFVVMGVGSLAGSLWLASLGGGRPLVSLILGGGILMSAVLIALGFATWLPLVYGLLLVVGFCRMMIVNTINVTIQSNVSHALRGRVMSLYTTLFAAGAPLGGLLAGSVAQVWGAPAAFALGGVASAAVLALVGPRLIRSAAAVRQMAMTPVDAGAGGRPD